MSSSTGLGTRLRNYLMTGVSYMIPFVAAGGILIALGFALGALETGGKDGILAYDPAVMHVSVDDGGVITGFNPLHVGDWAYLIFWLGKSGFDFFVPVLAGYIAFAIADRPGIAPGFIAGALATGLGNAHTLGTGTGFLGAILGGLVAGYVAKWISGWSVPSWLRSLMPVVIIPLLATVVTGLAMELLFKAPISWLMTSMNNGLSGLGLGAMVVLGLLLGAMMAFDMGGPVNKVAYVFATTGLGAAATAASDPHLAIMAIVMAAGMTPPMGLALATVVRKNLFTEEERENGKAGWLLGASFITEGAIPFAAADPIRVIPSIMLGSAVTGVTVALLDVQQRAPHGGIFAIFVPGVVNNILGYLIALVIGTLVTAVAVIVAKSIGKK